ncbi:hypothetical protein Glove_34g11 [Diversispora epigaea]|uniref:Uncharacterized protein n=1 Tax=Diversispora epigaea TaxID=1348612 RepID=A0A397JGN0_9GLOM|nr:hypothetical protein Glove_34g11 [Diversispora epigaea]
MSKRIAYLNSEIKFSFLLKDKDGNTNVIILNQFLSRHKITLSILRKIRADHAFRVYRGKNNSCRQILRQLAYRHKIDHTLSVEHYDAINDRPIMYLDTSSIIPAPRLIFPIIK